MGKVEWYNSSHRAFSNQRTLIVFSYNAAIIVIVIIINMRLIQWGWCFWRWWFCINLSELLHDQAAVRLSTLWISSIMCGFVKLRKSLFPLRFLEWFLNSSPIKKDQQQIPFKSKQSQHKNMTFWRRHITMITKCKLSCYQ